MRLTRPPRDRYDLRGQFIKASLMFIALMLLGMTLMVMLGHAQMTCNCGPNTQTSGAPANPVVQSIHPR